MMTLDNTERAKLAETAMMAIMEARDADGKVRPLNWEQVREVLVVAMEATVQLQLDAARGYPQMRLGVPLRAAAVDHDQQVPTGTGP